jgi:hypothetical protein
MGRPSDPGSRARTSQQHQQAAAAGQYSYESLDYEVVDNVVYRADEASCTHFDVIARGGVKWLLCFLVGGWLTASVNRRKQEDMAVMCCQQLAASSTVLPSSHIQCIVVTAAE